MGDGMNTTKMLHSIQLYLYSTYSSSSSVVFVVLSPLVCLYMYPSTGIVNPIVVHLPAQL